MWKKAYKALIVGVLAGIITTLILSSCTAPRSASSNVVSRYIDRDAGVVCWTYQSGISCLPIDATTLAK